MSHKDRKHRKPDLFDDGEKVGDYIIGKYTYFARFTFPTIFYKYHSSYVYYRSSIG